MFRGDVDDANFCFQIDLSKLKVVTVMPCYDKKLEAVRPDFTLLQDSNIDEQQPPPPSKEIDTVLATHELLDLFAEKGIDISAVEPDMPGGCGGLPAANEGNADNEDSQMTHSELEQPL